MEPLCSSLFHRKYCLLHKHYVNSWFTERCYCKQLKLYGVTRWGDKLQNMWKWWRPILTQAITFLNFKIMHPVVLNYKIRNNQTTIKYNFIEYSQSYMFQPRGVNIRLAFWTYSKKCTYRIVEVSSHFLQTYLQFHRNENFNSKIMYPVVNIFERSEILYAFFWAIPRRLNVICRRFGTLCMFHLHRQVGRYLPAYEDGTRVFRKVGI